MPRFLPGFLVPGPLVFVERTDSFVVANSDYGLESFKYQGLAIATDDRWVEKLPEESTQHLGIAIIPFFIMSVSSYSL